MRIGKEDKAALLKVRPLVVHPISKSIPQHATIIYPLAIFSVFHQAVVIRDIVRLAIPTVPVWAIPTLDPRIPAETPTMTALIADK